MADRKLFECRYEVIYYAYVETEDEARECLDKARWDEPFDEADVQTTEVRYAEYSLDGGWEANSIAYGDGQDEKVGDVLKKLPDLKTYHASRRREITDG